MVMHLISDVPEALFCASLECAYRTRLLSRGTHVGRRWKGIALGQMQLLLKGLAMNIRVFKRLSWEVVPVCYLP